MVVCVPKACWDISNIIKHAMANKCGVNGVKFERECTYKLHNAIDAS